MIRRNDAIAIARAMARVSRLGSFGSTSNVRFGVSVRLRGRFGFDLRRANMTQLPDWLTTSKISVARLCDASNVHREN